MPKRIKKQRIKKAPLTSCEQFGDSYFDSLPFIPDEILLHIFSFLSQLELCTASNVCHRFYSIFRDTVKHLIIEGNNLRPDKFKKFLISKPPIRKLSLINSGCITDHTMQILAENCLETLTDLDLQNCAKVSDLGLESIAIHCKHLRNLRLIGDVTKITPQTLQSFANMKVNLTSLEYACDPYIPLRDTIKLVIENFPNLAFLNFRETLIINSELRQLTQTHSLTHLKSLGIHISFLNKNENLSELWLKVEDLHLYGGSLDYIKSTLFENALLPPNIKTITLHECNSQPIQYFRFFELFLLGRVAFTRPLQLPTTLDSDVLDACSTSDKKKLESDPEMIYKLFKMFQELACINKVQLYRKNL